MTLAIIAHNEKDIVLGTDKLIYNFLNDKVEFTYEKKITPLNKRAALVYTGIFDGYMRQFAKTFVELRKDVTDIIRLRDEFMYSKSLPSLREGHDVQFCFVGYVNDKPCIKAVHFEYGKQPQPYSSNHIYFPTGFEGPSKRANVLLEEKHISNAMRTADLKEAIKDVLSQCIEEFKDSKDERLGGKPDIHILRQR